MNKIFAAALLLIATAARADDAAWLYGAFADYAYLRAPNEPSNHLFRSRGTTFHLNEWDLNMAAVYAKKAPAEQSRWGTELTVQTGKDTEVFGFSASAPNMGEARWLKHLGPANVSYLFPGRGVTVQGGIFSSLIGYDALYAKDNFETTRPWGADSTPYFMMGINAAAPIADKLTGTLFVVNGYWHLAHANDVPSAGGQLAYKPSDRWTVKETLMAGPHQSNTSSGFWRYLNDGIVEWKGGRTTTAFELIAGEERIDAPGTPRALWVASQLPIHRALTPRFSVTVRPEFYWDRDGRTTGFRQKVKANTTTLEWRVPRLIVRLEHRIDRSTGPEGGFFTDGDLRLTPNQSLVILNAIVTFEAKR